MKSMIGKPEAQGSAEVDAVHDAVPAPMDTTASHPSLHETAIAEHVPAGPKSAGPSIGAPPPSAAVPSPATGDPQPPQPSPMDMATTGPQGFLAALKCLKGNSSAVRQLGLTDLLQVQQVR